jgi:hypothetical protein
MAPLKPHCIYRFWESLTKLVFTHGSVLNDKTPLPPPASTPEEDEQLLVNEPWIDGPLKMDYGYNVK